MEDNQIIDKPKMYQAIGIISGVLELMQPPYSNLVVGDHTYSVTVSQKAEVKHEPGQLQNFKVYPLITKGKLGFSLLRVIKEAPEKSGMTLKGCWVMYEEQPRLIIYRNKNRNSGESKTVLQLIWEEAPVADGKYWEIEAEVNGEKITVIEAIGPFTPPRKSFGKNTKTKPTGIKSKPLPPILESTKSVAKSDAPPPILKSSKTPIAAIEPPKSKPIIETANELIAFVAGHGAIEDLNIATKSAEAIKPIAAGEIKAIAESPSKQRSKFSNLLDFCQRLQPVIDEIFISPCIYEVSKFISAAVFQE
jgi:hypothetical protein